MIVILTEHAKICMAQKAINLEQIKRAIQQGAKIKQTDGLLAIYADIEIAYKVRDDKYILKGISFRTN